MDWMIQKKHSWEVLKKYRYVALALLAGILLMLLPDKKTVPTEPIGVQEEKTIGLQEELAGILSHVQGAGSVEVLLTQAKGEQTIYQTDGTVSDQEERRDTVLISTSQKEEEGLVRQVNPPVYQGALILCQGADNANVRLSIVEAVMSVTGLTSDRITVLKMK